MKIICIGRNYSEHIKELANEKPEEPVVFLKPETALVTDNQFVKYPDFTRDLHHEIELVLRISKPGKNVGLTNADQYYDAIGLGVDFTARDLQSKQKSKGLPWEIAKSFDQSAPVSAFIPKTELPDLTGISFRLSLNGTDRQKGSSADMMFSFGEIISWCSRFFTLQPGDLIFTGTPSGVGPVQCGDHLEGFLGEMKMLDFKIV
jgi:2-keto-4-pentenoate hydratase/2-oxohepta-3-ene-1,7-dioic acid hydratase in catechol pathway